MTTPLSADLLHKSPIRQRMAESIIGLFKTEVINVMGPWKSVGKVEWETMNWVSWYNSERLHSAIGYVPPQEAEEAFYETLNTDKQAA
jgi:transposase InsO family protein